MSFIPILCTYDLNRNGKNIVMVSCVTCVSLFIDTIFVNIFYNKINTELIKINKNTI